MKKYDARMYNVQYKMDGIWSETKSITIYAPNKEDAWTIATFERIPELEGRHAYSVWVDSVIFKNGNTKYLDTWR